MRYFEIPKSLESSIQKVLEGLGVLISDVRTISQAVRKMSDFYIQNPEAQTPWDKDWAQIAQLAYYLPLNYLRARAVVEEGARLGFFDGLSSVLETGSGLGALTAHFENHFSEVYCREISTLANQIHQKLFSYPKNFLDKKSHQTADAIAFSYALTELGFKKDFFKSYRAVLIIEPSTSQDGRRLLELREELIQEGFFIWAPCTHQKKCPLLHLSKRDWCHDRIHIKMPDWFLKIEEDLPFKNKTITFSYLLARKDKKHSFKTNLARVTGDLLKEKGKKRILVCRNDKREFLSTLDRDGLNLELHRGELIDLDQYSFEEKSNELRLKP